MKIEKQTESRLPVFAQLCKLVAPHLVPKLACEHGIDKQARNFTPQSYGVSLLFAAKNFPGEIIQNLALLRNALLAIIPFEDKTSLNTSLGDFVNRPAKALNLIQPARPI